MKFNSQKASILVVTLIILGVILVTALSISLVSVKERKASLGANKSNLAFQTANTGIEKVMDAILETRTGNSSATGNDLTGCSGGKISGNGYVVELKKDGGTGSPTLADCGDRLNDIIAIKSVGTASGQEQRAIEAAVAAPSTYSGCVVSPIVGTATRDCGKINLVIGSENICTDGDGCNIVGATKFISGNPDVTRTSDNPMYWQVSNGTWASGNQSGNNGNSTRNLVSAFGGATTIDLFDDVASAEAVSICGDASYSETSDAELTVRTTSGTKWVVTVCD